nr:hypothetical protein [Tanacetum cinerariifolium]
MFKRKLILMHHPSRSPVRLLKVPDEQHLKTIGAYEGTGTIPGVLHVPIYIFESRKESWGDSGEEYEDDECDSVDKSDGNDNDDGSGDDHDNDIDDKRTAYDRDEIPDPNLTNTYYAFPSGEKTPKLKYVQKKADSDTSPKQKPGQATKGTRLKTKAKVAKSDKKKQPAKKPKAKSIFIC